MMYNLLKKKSKCNLQKYAQEQQTIIILKVYMVKISKYSDIKVLKNQ